MEKLPQKYTYNKRITPPPPNHHPSLHPWAQKLCKSWGGCPGLPIPNSPSGLCGCKATFEEAPPPPSPPPPFPDTPSQRSFYSQPSTHKTPTLQFEQIWSLLIHIWALSLQHLNTTPTQINDWKGFHWPVLFCLHPFSLSLSCPFIFFVLHLISYHITKKKNSDKTILSLKPYIPPFQHRFSSP